MMTTSEQSLEERRRREVEELQQFDLAPSPRFLSNLTDKQAEPEPEEQNN